MITHLIIGLVAGFVVGLAYFQALWWTVSRVTIAEGPHIRYAVSFVVRMGVLLGLAVALAQWSIWAIVGAPVGFLVARHVMVRRVEGMG